MCVYSAISNMSWTKKSSLRLSLVLMLLCAALYMIYILILLMYILPAGRRGRLLVLFV